jgi:hypothetical protein
LACPGCGIDFVSSFLSISPIGVSVAFAVSALFTAWPCGNASGVDDEAFEEELSDDDGTDEDDESDDEAGGAEAGGDVGVRAAVCCFATSSDRLQAPSATLSANNEINAACMRAFI